MTAALVAAAAALFAVVGFLTGRRITQHRSDIRLRRVADATNQLQQGASIVIDDRGNDAIAAVARSVDALGQSLASAKRVREDTERRLNQLAHHDSLTGLPNRSTIRDSIDLFLSITPPNGSVGVFFLDLDQFKTVNDGLGHSMGDLLLCEVAFRLRQAVDARSHLGRFGGDEFVIVTHSLSGEHDAWEIAERVQASLASPIRLAGRMFSVGMSIGISLNSASSTAETLIQEADAAMYRAKQTGRHRAVLHTEEIRSTAADRLTSMVELHRAIAENELRMVVQPIFDLITYRTQALEALVRWNHNGTEFDPGEFVGHAAELDLATELDDWVIHHVCGLAGKAKEAVLGGSGWLHLNVTIASLDNPDFPAHLASIAASHNVPIDALCLEVPEGYFSAAPESMLATMRELRARGVRIALDDFGTGYSSLHRLSELPVDVVKIDQSFVRDLESQPTRQAIIEAMVALSRRLNIEVMAEGVETEAQRDILVRLGCRLGQGFLFSVPLPLEQLARA